MTHPIEFMNALMVTSAAFMTIAGIVFGFAGTRQDFGKWNVGFLFISLLFGALSTTFSLSWFSTPSIWEQLLAELCLLAQFIIMMIPLARSTKLFGK